MNNTDIKNFYHADKYFLVDTINGNLKASNINLKLIPDSPINLRGRLTYKVLSKKRIEDTDSDQDIYTSVETLGFVRTSLEPYQEDLDVINYEVLRLLGINAMPAFHLLTKDRQRGSILISALTLEDEIYTIEDLSKRMVMLIKQEKRSIPPFLANYIHLNAPTKDNPLIDTNLIKEILDFPINIISYVFNLDSKSLYKVKSTYINYLLGELLLNQNQIDLNTYGIYYNRENNIINLIPLYNYNSSLEKKDTLSLNNKYVDKEVLIDTLFTYYYDFFKDISRGLNENVSAYKKSIGMIIDNNTSSKYAKIITENIFNSIDHLTMEEEEHRLSFGESRIDMALTQTSINLNAVNRNQEVRNKYETVESHYKVLLEPPKEEQLEEEKHVSVKFEAENKPQKSHFGSIILAVFIILVVLAIGFGAYYLLTNYFD